MKNLHPYQQHYHIQNVPDTGEVWALVYSDLQYLLHNVVKDEHAEDHLTAHDEVIPWGNVSNQLNCPDLVWRYCSTSGRKLNHQPKKQWHFVM